MNKAKMFFIIPLVLGILAMANIPNERDMGCSAAISISEKKFASFRLNRDEYKLIRVENDILVNADKWKLTYIAKSCLSKEGLRNCLGGEVFVTVNIKTEEATIGYGE